MAEVAEVTDQNFDAEVLRSTVPVVVDFWAEWCGPCRVIAPIVKELAVQYAGKVKLVKVDVDANPQTPAKFGIRAIPTLLAFKGGSVVEQMQGARPKAALEDMLKKLL